MKKSLPIIIGVLVICAFAFLFAHVKKGHALYDNDVDTATYVPLGLLDSATELQQQFICQEDSMDGLYFKLDVYGDCTDVMMNIAVSDVESGTVLSENCVSVTGVKNRKLNYFAIDSVEGYNGKALELTMSQDSSVEGAGVGFYIQPGIPSAPAHVDDAETGGVLVMKHVSERFDMETFWVVIFFCSFIWVFLWFLYRLFR